MEGRWQRNGLEETGTGPDRHPTGPPPLSRGGLDGVPNVVTDRGAAGAAGLQARGRPGHGGDLCGHGAPFGGGDRPAHRACGHAGRQPRVDRGDAALSRGRSGAGHRTSRPRRVAAVRHRLRGGGRGHLARPSARPGGVRQRQPASDARLRTRRPHGHRAGCGRGADGQGGTAERDRAPDLPARRGGLPRGLRHDAQRRGRRIGLLPGHAYRRRSAVRDIWPELPGVSQHDEARRALHGPTGPRGGRTRDATPCWPRRRRRWDFTPSRRTGTGRCGSMSGC